MAKEKEQKEQPTLAALILSWERARGADNLDLLSTRTAALLSRVTDVPQPVLEHLDRLMSFKCEGHGTAIYHVVRYLRELEQLECLLTSECDKTESRVDA